jgi:hypothetical protein
MALSKMRKNIYEHTRELINMNHSMWGQKKILFERGEGRGILFLSFFEKGGGGLAFKTQRSR